jgi:hypothetical protein
MKTIIYLLLLLLLLALCSCGARFYHDIQNPCGVHPEYADPEACDRWAQDYPKEYARYLERKK